MVIMGINYILGIVGIIAIMNLVADIAPDQRHAPVCVFRVCVFALTLSERDTLCVFRVCVHFHPHPRPHPCSISQTHLISGNSFGFGSSLGFLETHKEHHKDYLI